MIADVAIVMGSMSDHAVMRCAVECLDRFCVSYRTAIVSAHRTPERLYKFARSAHESYRILIAGAGGAAHLPGMLASMALIPTFGVPIPTNNLQGVDSLLSIVQMPRGVTVGTFAIGKAGAFNAALMAVEVLALSRKELFSAIQQYKADLAAQVPFQWQEKSD